MSNKKIEDLASTSLQEIAEAIGTLRVIDATLEERRNSNSNIIWALRNAVRNLEGSEEKLAEIIHLAETSQDKRHSK